MKVMSFFTRITFFRAEIVLFSLFYPFFIEKNFLLSRQLTPF